MVTWTANNATISAYDSELYAVWPFTTDAVDIVNEITLSTIGSISFGANGVTSTTDGPDRLELNGTGAFHSSTGFGMSFELYLNSGNDDFTYPAWANSEYGIYTQGGLSAYKGFAGSYETSTTTLTETTWYLMTVFACNGNVLLYKNGVLAGSNYTFNNVIPSFDDIFEIVDDIKGNVRNLNYWKNIDTGDTQGSGNHSNADALATALYNGGDYASYIPPVSSSSSSSTIQTFSTSSTSVSSSTIQTFSTSSTSISSSSESSSSSTIQTFSTNSTSVSSSASTTTESSSTIQTFSTNSTSVSSSSSTIQTFSTSSTSISSSTTTESSSSSLDTTSVSSSTTTESSTSTTSESTASTSSTTESSLSTTTESSNSSSSTLLTTTSVSTSSGTSLSSISSSSLSTTSVSSLSTLDTTSVSSLSTTSLTTTSLSSSSSDLTSLSTSSLSSSISSQSDNLFTSEVINRIRKLLNDPDATRYTDTNLLYWINDAIRTIRRMRYETRLDSDGNLLDFIEVTSVNDSIPLDEEWQECLTNYVCYRAFTEISENMSDKFRAPIFKELFHDTLGL